MYLRIKLQCCDIKRVAYAPGSLQDPGTKLQMLAADRVVDRQDPFVRLHCGLFEWCTVENLSIYKLGSRYRHEMEKPAGEDVAMLLSQNLNRCFVALLVWGRCIFGGERGHLVE